MAKQWTDDAALVDAISMNLFDALPRLPRRLVKLDTIVREYRMPFSQIQILCMLYDREMAIGEISTSLGIAKPNITPLLDAMVTRGILERCRSEKDHRIVIVRLLPRGREMAEQLRRSIAAQVKDWPDAIGLSDIKRLNNALACLVDIASRLFAPEISTK